MDLIYLTLISIILSSSYLFHHGWGFVAALTFLFLLANILPSTKKLGTWKISALNRAVVLLKAFWAVLCYDLLALIMYVCFQWEGWEELLYTALPMLITTAVLFWNGIIRTYIFSGQLKIKLRVLGILCWPVPILNLIVLWYILLVAAREVVEEDERYFLDQIRAENEICKTKYPLLMIHGVFFRDYRFFRYWGRIPSILIKNGATIYYGEQQSADSIENAGKEIAKRVRQIVDSTGCGKVNIIAHSKGGVDARSAITNESLAPYIASLTTINAPHRGCKYADAIFRHVKMEKVERFAKYYNSVLHKVGDHNPDFLSAVLDLTEKRCMEFNETCPDSKGVFYQSYGSYANNSRGGKFPLNISYRFVKHFDGKNDGLVAERSMRWGEKYTLLEPAGRRGITHGDMIDLNRENIEGFDIREIYVKLVADLKKRGY